MVLLPDFTVCLQFNQICLSLYVISRAAFALLPLKTSTRLQVEGGGGYGQSKTYYVLLSNGSLFKCISTIFFVVIEGQ